jgi:hypothetical protein
MNVGDERSKSIWVDADVAPDATPLEKDMQVDTVVVGSGSPGSRRHLGSQSRAKKLLSGPGPYFHWYDSPHNSSPDIGRRRWLWHFHQRPR